MDKGELFRSEVDRLIRQENRPPEPELPLCPFDGKPCSTPSGGCQAAFSGFMAQDGEEEIVWKCPRFPYAKESCKRHEFVKRR